MDQHIGTEKKREQPVYSLIGFDDRAALSYAFMTCHHGIGKELTLYFPDYTYVTYDEKTLPSFPYFKDICKQCREFGVAVGTEFFGNDQNERCGIFFLPGRDPFIRLFTGMQDTTDFPTPLYVALSNQYQLLKK